MLTPERLMLWVGNSVRTSGGILDIIRYIYMTMENGSHKLSVQSIPKIQEVE